MNEGHALADNYWDVFIDMCSNNYNTTANESIWEVEFAGNYTEEVRAEGRIGNLLGIKCPDVSNEQSIIGKQDPGYGYAYYWSTPKLYDLYVNNNDQERFYWNLAPFEYVEKTKGKGVTGRKFEKMNWRMPVPKVGGISHIHMGKAMLPIRREITRMEQSSINRVPVVNSAENMNAKMRKE